MDNGSLDGIWNSTGKSFHFRLVTPITDSPWFMGLIMVLAVLGLGGTLVAALRWLRKSFIRRRQPYEGAILDPVRSKVFLKKLIHLMEEEKIYREDDLSLRGLAQRLSVSVHFLSQLINEKMDTNYIDLVNGYRIAEVKERLRDSKYGDYSILAIAYDCGFNNKSTFNRCFKTMTGMTPSQYRKQSNGKIVKEEARKIQ